MIWKDDNWFIKLKEEMIDDIDIDSVNPFNITKEYVYDRYNTFNKLYFMEMLPQLNISQFFVNTSAEYMGITHYKPYVYEGTNKIAYLDNKTIQIKISTRHERTEKVYCETLLHEMIHVWQINILKIEADHKYEFIDKMLEINEYGWKITIEETDEEINQRGQVDNKVSSNIIKNKYFGTRYIPEKDSYLAFIFPKKQLDLFKQKIKNFNLDAHVYEILDATPFLTWSSTSMKTCLSGYKRSLEEIQDMIQDNQIKEFDIKLNESIQNGKDPRITSTVIRKIPEKGIVFKDITII